MTQSEHPNHAGCFTKIDVDGEKRAIWTDTFMTEVAPWTWWPDVAQAEDPELFRFTWRTLQVWVASSCNARVSSAWKHNIIMGDKRTRLGSKRQREQISIYTHSRVLKKFKGDPHADYEPAVAAGSDDSESDGPQGKTMI